MVDEENVTQGYLKKHIVSFVNSCEVSDTTSQLYYSYVNSWVRKFDNNLSLQENYDLLCNAMLKKGDASNSIHSKTRVIQRFLEYAGLDVTCLTSYQRVPDKRDYVPVEVIQSILSCGYGRPLQEVQILLSTGLRSGELARMKYDDVNWDERLLHVPHGKGGKERLIPLSDGCLSFLKNDLKDFSKGKPFLWYSRKRNNPISRRTIEMDIEKLSRQVRYKFVPHQLRHTYATFLGDCGLPDNIISLLLGHEFRNGMRGYYNHNIEPSFTIVQNEFDKYQGQLDNLAFGRSFRKVEEEDYCTLDDYIGRLKY